MRRCGDMQMHMLHSAATLPSATTLLPHGNTQKVNLKPFMCAAQGLAAGAAGSRRIQARKAGV